MLGLRIKITKCVKINDCLNVCCIDFSFKLSFWYEMTTGTEVKIAFASFYVLI